MTTHRFYIGIVSEKSGPLALTEHVWVNDPLFVSQISRVLRMRTGEKVILFDGHGDERLYEITKIEPTSIGLQRVTDITPVYPKRKVLLAFSMLKKDKNEWVFQKCTELGVSHFLPIITDRTEKTGFDSERAQKIVIEATEQCGRHDIPLINEPQPLREVIGEYQHHMPIYVADMGHEKPEGVDVDQAMILVGPEGGWSDAERQLFTEKDLLGIGLGDFTLRAETACIAAVRELL